MTQNKKENKNKNKNRNRNPYEFLLPRMEGSELEKDPSRYAALVDKGVAGFILFGGRLEAVKEGLAELQKRARMPLIIASDLERGLGQQVLGGTLMPSAMAIGSAWLAGIGEDVLRRAFSGLALQARWAGINMIFAPVLDINSNPENPIIATRAFGEEPETVSRLGVLMTEEIEKQGVYACGKHYPGHGDTHEDSHSAMPSVSRTIEALEEFELRPFRAAIGAGVSAIMTAHLKIPLIDTSGLPATLSGPAIGYLRRQMGFKGLIVTDALNMAGTGMKEEQAAGLALEAGANILLHPADPDKTAAYLAAYPGTGAEADAGLLREKRLSLAPSSLSSPARNLPDNLPDLGRCRELARQIALKAIRAEGQVSSLRQMETCGLSVAVLSDNPQALLPFTEALKGMSPGIKMIVNPGRDFFNFSRAAGNVPGGLIVAVHSTPEAWKPPTEALKENIERFAAMDFKAVWLSFGNPYIIPRGLDRLLTYSDTPEIQREMAKRIAAGRLD